MGETRLRRVRQEQPCQGSAAKDQEFFTTTASAARPCEPNTSSFPLRRASGGQVAGPTADIAPYTKVEQAARPRSEARKTAINRQAEGPPQEERQVELGETRLRRVRQEQPCQGNTAEDKEFLPQTLRRRGSVRQREAIGEKQPCQGNTAEDKELLPRNTRNTRTAALPGQKNDENETGRRPGGALSRWHRSCCGKSLRITISKPAPLPLQMAVRPMPVTSPLHGSPPHKIAPGHKIW